jgi:acid phosphatase family membrane protein YuiD
MSRIGGGGVAEKKLGIVFTSDSKQAEKGIRDLNSALGSTEAQAKKSGAGIKTALAGLAIGSFVKSGLDSLGEIDRLNKQTESAIKATGGAAHVTADEVTSLAGAIEKKTGIEAESIQSGQNMLLTFKGIRNEAGAGNDIFNQATQTLADMSTAMGTDASTTGCKKSLRALLPRAKLSAWLSLRRRHRQHRYRRWARLRGVKRLNWTKVRGFRLRTHLPPRLPVCRQLPSHILQHPPRVHPGLIEPPSLATP